jgi:hypothetical protein
MEKHIICMFIGFHDEFKANHSAQFKNHSQTSIKTMAAMASWDVLLI